MAISGLVITLDDNDFMAEQAIRSLSGDRRFSLGERAGGRIPLVAETPGPEADAELWADLLATPGIKSVDVTFVSIEPATGDAAGPSPAGRTE